MKIEKLLEYIKNNKWILAATAFFIGWKFFLINLFLKQPLIPDAYVYIAHIKSLVECNGVIFCKEFIISLNTYFGFEHLSYRLFFGFIGHILQLSSPYVFYLSFYLGIIFLVPTLIIFLKNINPDKKLIAFSLFFLALFNGSGSYHGFYWVVPSFFSLMLVFVLFGVIIGNHKHWVIIILFLIPIALYTHTLSMYLILVLIPFFIIYSFITNKLDLLLTKKIALSIIVLFISYFLVSMHIKVNPYGIDHIMKQKLAPAGQEITIFPQLQKVFPGLEQIKTDYLNFIFLNPLFILLFIYIIIILIYYKQYKIISLYFASLSLTLISTINYSAVRSLILTWPLTFILYSYGAWFSFKLNNDLVKNKMLRVIINIGISVAVLFFIAINIAYSYFMNKGISFNIRTFLGL